MYKINQTTDDYDSDNESLVKKNRKSNINGTSGIGGNVDMSFNNQ